jgi:ABC-type transport system involved in cytochrome c biogenesis ATPase subunit
LWQRDAIRRIVGAGPLTANDLKELAEICRAQHGIVPPSGAAPTPVPFSSDHSPAGLEGNSTVCLKQLSALQNVGRIPSDQGIDFGPSPGLTVVYGENGAGKSGYARVIKKACRARGTIQEIKPDAFATAPTSAASARIECRVAAVDTTVDWRDGSATDPNLSNIFVFDSLSARAHVGKEDPASFKPRGLDVLPELAKACDQIKAGLQSEIEEVYAQNAVVLNGWTPYKAATKAGMLLNALALTTPETIESAAVFTTTDEARLAEIGAMLGADPKIKSADTVAAAKRIRDFANTTKSRATSVDDTQMQIVGDAIHDADTTEKAAKATAGPELMSDDLPGSCSAVWLKLWEAAKAYSVADAYPDKEFPAIETGARCVLCQQDLSPNAINRYARFNKFVSNETRRQAEAAKARVAALKPGVDSLTPTVAAAAGIKVDLDREAVGLFTAVEAYANTVDVRITHARNCLKDVAWSDPPALPASPVADLVALADCLDTRAKNELAAADPEKARALALERDELTDKKFLTDRKGEVLAQIERHRFAATLKKCQEDCKTYAVTLKGGELNEAHVTTAFCKAFDEELADLRMTTLPVKLDVSKGVKGEQRFAVKPIGTTSMNVSDIASEGEHGCIALAAFLAELSQASHRSALVFDDPVSSLDHKRRDAIAARLAKEAKQRQVIVFTHDLAFICDLQTAASDERVDTHYQQVEWSASAPGRVLNGLPWDAQSFKQQMKALREQVGKADKIHNDQGESEYRAAVLPVVDRFRGACERVIEECLLNNVVRRHESQIKVGNIEAIAVVSGEQYKVVRSIWRECSNIIEAHAKPRSGPTNVPLPADMKKWVQSLESVIEEVRVARNGGHGAGVAEATPAVMTCPTA